LAHPGSTPLWGGASQGQTRPETSPRQTVSPQPIVRQSAVQNGRTGSPHRQAGNVAVQTTLDPAGMRDYVFEVWRQNPILHRLMEVRGARGPARHQQILDILRDFERIEGVPVEVVPPGTVQRVRGRGNLASLRSRPGVLQIEIQAYADTDTLMREVIHELCYHYAGGPNHTRFLGESRTSALDIFEWAITRGEGERLFIRVLPVDETPRPRRR
jgi:hypothetical protein